MLHFCAVSDPSKLWDCHRDSLVEDALYQERKDNSDQMLEYTQYTQTTYNKTLVLLENKLLALGGQQITQYGLPAPDQTNI